MAKGNPYRVDPLYLKMTNPRDLGGSSLASVRDIYGGLSQTSQFKISMYLGRNIQGAEEDKELNAHFTRCGLFSNQSDAFRYDFFCSEATLPGATFNMGEEQGSRQGMMERFASKRIFSEFDLTFYVDSDYKIIRLFEEWMNFINPLYDDEGIYNGSPRAQVGYLNRSSYYRFRYPNQYKRLLAITKFERDFLPNPNIPDSGLNDPPMLTYQFIDAFPTNLTALPLSYEGTTITKTTVNFSYSRYLTWKHGGGLSSDVPRRSTAESGNPDQPRTQQPTPNPERASWRYTEAQLAEFQRGAYSDTTSGIPFKSDAAREFDAKYNIIRNSKGDIIPQ